MMSKIERISSESSVTRCKRHRANFKDGVDSKVRDRYGLGLIRIIF